MLAHTPLERLGVPTDIAGAVLYFAAPVSKWVSGQVLFVNVGDVQALDLIYELLSFSALCRW